MSTRLFHVLNEQDEDGVFVAEAPDAQVCCVQSGAHEEAFRGFRAIGTDLYRDRELTRGQSPTCFDPCPFSPPPLPLAV